MKAVACCATVILGVVSGFAVLLQPEAVQAQERRPDSYSVSDQDRAFLNFTREAATVGAGVLRVELRGFRSEDDDNPDLSITGFPLEPIRRKEVGNVYSETSTIDTAPQTPPNPEQQIDTVDTINDASLEGTDGGFISILGSYGLGANTEVGFDIPIFFRKVRLERSKTRVTTTTTFPATGDPTVAQSTMMLTDIVGQNEEDIGDITLYGKFKYQVAQHCRIGAGVEITPPTGPERKFFGTGELGVNPFLATRYQRGWGGVEAHIGYFLYTGDVPDVFNYSAAVFVRPASIYAFRIELSGRHFDDFGQSFDDVVVLPGIDFDITQYVTLRPVGMFNISDESQDWGIGMGLAVQLPIL